MNCDDVFDALTDPALASSAELAKHLATCPRCRQLQQVLEPARALLCGNLPAERVPVDETRQGATRAGQPAFPLLSIEAVGLAETIAARLAKARGGKSVPPRPPLAKGRFVVAALRGTALVLFGALAVYCITPSDRDSDAHALPAFVPAGKTTACTRTTLQRKGQSQDARRVILSCVGCHLNENAPRAIPASSFFRPTRRPSALQMTMSEMRMTKVFGPDAQTRGEARLS